MTELAKYAITGEGQAAFRQLKADNTRFAPLLLTKAMELNGTEEESKSWLKTLRMARKQREFCLLIMDLLKLKITL